MVLLPEMDYIRERVKRLRKKLSLREGCIALESTLPLRTMSSGVIGSGSGWHDTFVNRHVDRNYNCDNHREEMASFFKGNGLILLKRLE